MSYLHRFPATTLKVDRSFVGRIGKGDGNDEIIQTIVTLGRNLKMEVVAEGVETEEQRQYLADLDCDYVQGYLLSRPLDVRSVTELLRRHLPHRLPWGEGSAERRHVSM